MKINVVKIPATLSALLILLLIITSCNSTGSKDKSSITNSNEQPDKREDICKKMTWMDMSNAIRTKDNPKSSMMIGNMKFYGCDLSKDESHYVIESYNLAENIVMKRDLVAIIRSKSSSFDESDLNNFFLKVSRDDDPLLASQAIEVLPNKRYIQELIDIYKKRDNSKIGRAHV